MAFWHQKAKNCPEFWRSKEQFIQLSPAHRKLLHPVHILLLLCRSVQLVLVFVAASVAKPSSAETATEASPTKFETRHTGNTNHVQNSQWSTNIDPKTFFISHCNLCHPRLSQQKFSTHPRFCAKSSIRPNPLFHVNFFLQVPWWSSSSSSTT